MNTHDLFNEVHSWLEAEKLAFFADDEDADFQLRMNLEHGLVPVRLMCEESPTLLQMACTLPVKVSKAKLPGISLMLHHLNARLRMGSFQLVAEDSLIMYRLSQAIHPDSDLTGQFNGAFGTALHALDDNFQSLALYLCSTPLARKEMAKSEPVAKSADSKSAGPGPRFELN
jgi:hypothetical protein